MKINTQPLKGLGFYMNVGAFEQGVSLDNCGCMLSRWHKEIIIFVEHFFC